jgi:hypothetical protein
VVRVGVRQDDAARGETIDFAEPVGAAVDQDLVAAVGDQQRAVPSMTARSSLDLAASRER